MLNPDFKEFIESLNYNGVRYLVVGGYAVAFHGLPRYTKDLDIWLELSSDNAKKVICALESFGFGSLGLTEEDFLEKDQIIQLGLPPARIDLLTQLTGLTFDECYHSHVVIETDGLTIPIIDRQNLIINKKATGRIQDLADVEGLERLESEE